MNEKRNRRFWVQLALFQVIFGLAVFFATRAFYLDEPQPAASAARGTQTAAPHAVPPPSSQDDLAGLIARVPGPFGTDPDDLARQGDDFFSNGQYPQAAEAYQLAMRAGDLDVNTWNSLGLTLHYIGRTEEALAVLEEGLERDPAFQRIWLTMGFVSGQAGDFGRAREALRMAVEINPDSDIGQSAAGMLQGLP
jgi:tetratricopeptide (TPR) repeat protein